MPEMPKITGIFKCYYRGKQHTGYTVNKLKDKKDGELVSHLVCFFLMFIYFLRETKTEHQWGRGTEREIQNLKKAPG